MNVSQVTLLHEYLERNVARCPEKTALVFQGQRLSWAEVDERSSRLARALLELGVQRGDRVVIYLDNSVETCVALLGVLKADAVFCVINAQTKADKLVYMLNDCRAKVVISDQLLERIHAQAFPGTPHVQHALLVTEGDAALPPAIGTVKLHRFNEVLAASAPERPPTRNIPIDLAAMIYTSGTTGEPKGVMLTHHNMVSAAESITTYLRNVPEDIVLNVLPMSFDYGMYQWLMVNQFGGTLVLERSFNYPAPILKLVEDEHVTGFPVVPTMVSILRTFAHKGLRLPGVKYATNTAAALSGAHIDTLKLICPTARIYSMYGLTECKRVAYLPPEEIDRRPDSVGRPMPNMEVFIVDEQGRRVPPNTVGELVIRGPHVMQGYWEKPEATARRLKPGELPGERHLYSGDLFRMDDEGYLYFMARGDDMIKSRGEKVSPKEVENAIYGMAGVQDVAVIGVPDEILGQAVKAYVVLTGEKDYRPAEVVRYCSLRLEPFMVPKYVSFLSSLPKTSSGKITKQNLADWAKRTHVGGDAP